MLISRSFRRVDKLLKVVLIDFGIANESENVALEAAAKGIGSPEDTPQVELRPSGRQWTAVSTSIGKDGVSDSVKLACSAWNPSFEPRLN